MRNRNGAIGREGKRDTYEDDFDDGDGAVRVRAV